MNVEALTKIAQSKPVAQPVSQPVARPAANAQSPDLVAQRAEQAMKLVAPFIEKHEGFRQKAYWDKIGKKWTVGHGHTFIRDAKTGKLRAVTKGDTMDAAASSALVRDRLRSNAASMYKDLQWTRTLSPGALAALYDIAYNAGPGVLSAAKSPSLNRKMNAPGADREAVAWSEVPTYKKSGGKVVKGLVNRRADAVKAFRNLQPPKIGT